LFDPHNQYVGVKTDLDKRHASTEITGPISDNPMDPNWGGVAYTQSTVDSGKYAGEEIIKPLMPGRVNTSFLPIDYGASSTPSTLSQPTSNDGGFHPYNQ
jgi:hypothetical protein